MDKTHWLLVFVCILIFIAGAFYLIVPGYVEKAQNKVIAHSPWPVTQQAEQLHSSLVIADLHADSLLWNRNLLEKSNYGHVDIPRLQSGNVTLQVFTTVTKSPRGLNYQHNPTDAPDDITALAIAQAWPPATWQNLTNRAMHQAKKLHRFADRSPESLMIVKSREDLAQLLQARQAGGNTVGTLLGTEGSHALEGQLENIDRLYDAGFRMMSLQHFFDNRLGGSLHGTTKSGLTEFGREVVNSIVNKQIILDVSHSSEAVVIEVLKLIDAPVIVSHTGFAGHCDSPRNIQDSTMKAIAGKGGLIGVGYWQEAVCGTTPKDIVAAIRYGIDLVGEDSVALGSDFDGAVTTQLDTSELAALTTEMLRTGFTEVEIRKVMGENVIRFFQKHLPSNAG